MVILRNVTAPHSRLSKNKSMLADFRNCLTYKMNTEARLKIDYSISTSAETIIRLFDYSVGMTLFDLLPHYLNNH